MFFLLISVLLHAKDQLFIKEMEFLGFFFFFYLHSILF